MAYLAIYRRFRPQGFDKLVGQESVVKILRNQISTGNIGHAYLFCGARGTGKTTAAKVFARAINCLNPHDGSPCNECEVCKSLATNNDLDVLEMDAASNNTVDDIRAMREKIQYPPVNCKYKVYIIDEVHMLSPQAFNALLKTLEEPPKHAVFILATTEVNKIPTTILSRCMRFDFKLISVEKISQLIKSIYDELGKKYETEAITAIARAGAGSIRDALSVADICLSFSNTKLTYNDVLEVLGATDTGKVIELLRSIIESNTGDALRFVDVMNSLGKNMRVLASDLTENLRNLIIIKTMQKANTLLALPQEWCDKLKSIADLTESHRLLRCLEIFSSLDNDFRYSNQPRIVLETAVIKASEPETDYNIDALLSRITLLENKLKNGEFAVSERKTNENYVKTEEKSEKEPEKLKIELVTESKPQIHENNSETKISQEPDISDDDYNYDEEYLPEITDNDVPSEEIETITTRKPPEPKIEFVKSENVPSSKIWGRILSDLRSRANYAIWAVLQDARAEVDGENVTVRVLTDTEYEFLSRENNLSLLNGIAGQFGKYKVKIAKLGNNSQTETGINKNDINRVVQLFGEEVIERD